MAENWTVNNDVETNVPFIIREAKYLDVKEIHSQYGVKTKLLIKGTYEVGGNIGYGTLFVEETQMLDLIEEGILMRCDDQYGMKCKFTMDGPYQVVIKEIKAGNGRKRKTVEITGMGQSPSNSPPARQKSTNTKEHTSNPAPSDMPPKLPPADVAHYYEYALRHCLLKACDIAAFVDAEAERKYGKSPNLLETSIQPMAATLFIQFVKTIAPFKPKDTATGETYKQIRDLAAKHGINVDVFNKEDPAKWTEEDAQRVLDLCTEDPNDLFTK